MSKICSRINTRTLPSLLLAGFLSACLQGCLQPGTGSTSFLNTAGTSTIPGGPKAVQVIFTNQAAAGTGSFNTISSGAGTVNAAGQGLQAVKLFNPDGSLLTQSSAGGPSDPNWPAWLNYVEIGISGSNDTAATNPDCATFGGSTNCALSSGSTGSPVSVPCDVANTFRVSEYDCVSGGSSTNGNGTSSDGIYIRAYFNRANLGSSENIMVVVNYAASAFDAAPSNPTNCFSGGAFTPESCNDFTWRVFMRHSPTESYVQPFLMLVPPTYSYVNGNTISPMSSTTSETKQFIIPFAGDANLNTIQFSRTGSTLTTGTTNFTADCGSNTPLCAGIVFYSMTFFRI